MEGDARTVVAVEVICEADVTELPNDRFVAGCANFLKKLNCGLLMQIPVVEVLRITHLFNPR